MNNFIAWGAFLSIQGAGKLVIFGVVVPGMSHGCLPATAAWYMFAISTLPQGTLFPAESKQQFSNCQDSRGPLEHLSSAAGLEKVHFRQLAHCVFCPSSQPCSSYCSGVHSVQLEHTVSVVSVQVCETYLPNVQTAHVLQILLLTGVQALIKKVPVAQGTQLAHTRSDVGVHSRAAYCPVGQGEQSVGVEGGKERTSGGCARVGNIDNIDA